MFRFETAGESHGECLVATLTGLPAGIPIALDAINHELWRRQQGFGRGGRMKIETDRAHLVSGVRHGQTIGSPVAMIIANADWKNWTESLPVESGDPASINAPSRARVPAMPISPAPSNTTFPTPATSSNAPAPAKPRPALRWARLPNNCSRLSALRCSATSSPSAPNAWPARPVGKKSSNSAVSPKSCSAASILTPNSA